MQGRTVTTSVTLEKSSLRKPSGISIRRRRKLNLKIDQTIENTFGVYKRMGGYASKCAPQEDEVKTFDTNTKTEACKEKCPSCPGILDLCVDSTGYPRKFTQCSLCPELHFFCRSCLAPWPSASQCCRNQSCELVANLRTCDVVTNKKSNVFGCPLFRACPKCHNLIMHSNGCKYVTCQGCRHMFCFICLQKGTDCQKADLYWSLSCNKVRADRQRFVT